MNEYKQYEGAREPENQNKRLAQWLQNLLATTSISETAPSLTEDEQYHPHFYQQLPDFVFALLNNQPQATLHYAPLLYHLVGCPTCRAAYLDLYAAMKATLQPNQAELALNQSTGLLDSFEPEPIPPRMVVYLSQSLIHQAEAALRQGRREHTDNTELARSLLQQVMRISAHVTQNHLRSQALQDLVRVATLFESSSDTIQRRPPLHSYSPMIAGGMSATVRRADVTSFSQETSTGQHVIHLQAKMLEGAITQHDNTLELHLHNLDQALRGKHLIISIPLGSLIEPIRWHGGDPSAIRSTTPVDQQGNLNTPLGQTELQLNNPEERNLLEATFMLVEVRAAD
jgi:hypothetical protein